MPPFVAEVDLDAVRSNVAELRRRAGSAAVMAVVKADGYGHGMVPSARAAVEAGASWLGVAFIDEALALRAAGVDVPILAWLLDQHADMTGAVATAVALSVGAGWVLGAVRGPASDVRCTAAR